MSHSLLATLTPMRSIIQPEEEEQKERNENDVMRSHTHVRP